MTVIHLAGSPSGLVQKCARCGFVLQDYTNAMSVGDWKPSWFEGSVEVSGRYFYATEAAPNCSPAQGDQERNNER